MVTIKDVAKKAGVSISTVSRTLSGNIFVSDETKKKVLQVIEELDYTPNFFAKGLKEGKTGVIGLVIPNINNPIYPMVTKGIEDMARRKGYNVILCNTDERIDNEKKVIEILKKKWVDGIILASASRDPEYIHAVKEDIKIPMVLLVRSFKGKFDSIISNNFEASYEAVEYLIKRGHKKIAILNGDLEIELYRERFEGYKKAITDYDMELREERSFSCSFENKECYFKTLKLLKSGIDCDAIFATNDLRAIEAIKAIKDAGLKVPDNISVVGFDDIDISSMIDPPLTTVAQPFYQMGEVAVKRLVELIDSKGGKNKPKVTTLKSKLVVRGSTR